jgi:hypothetical protein
MGNSHDGTNGANGSNGANGAGSFEAHEEAAGERARAPLAPPPQPVAELVAACSRFVASKYKVALDGTPETLSLVDQYVRDARDAMKERPEAVELVAPAVGAYLGEVMRQSFGAEWFAEGAHEAWRLYFTNVYLSFNPLGMAREALTMREEEGWHAHLELDPAEREVVDERLAIVPEVEEEEYYLPSTRLEVVTIVVETLRARAEAAGNADVRFTRDDYD